MAPELLPSRSQPASLRRKDARKTRSCAAPSRSNSLLVSRSPSTFVRPRRSLPWYDVKQYIEDYRSGNVTIFQMISAWVFWTYHNLCGVGLGFGSAMRWAYDACMKAVGGSPYPWRIGKIPKGSRTPACKLDVQEGETVRIKNYHEILETLDEDWKNRGLYFDAEMVPYTNGTYKVLKRVNRIIDEKTGKMLNFKNECLILDEVVCRARYAKCRKLCPRAYYLYWREIWVEKVSGSKDSAKEKQAQA